IACAVASVMAVGAQAITFGEPDGTRHPYVGALVADWNEDSPGPDQFCSGTLVTPTLFRTAAHCMVDWPEGTQLWVTFAPVYDEDAAMPTGLVPVTDFTVHEGFGQPGGGTDAHGIGIVAGCGAQTTTPAQLPTLGLNHAMSQQQLFQLRFTTV